ncbi:MAG: methyltransferase [Candidatus Sulfobium sp.]|jgi:SAM-dependent methyltransferase
MTGEGGRKDLKWLRQVSSFTSSRIILTANRYRIFDLLENGEKSSSQVARALRTDGRATELLLNSLAAIGLLKKKAGRYRNEGVASRYLVKGKPDYQGDILDHYHILWENWSDLDRVVRTGRPSRRSHDHSSFILGMHNIALQRTGDVLAAIDLRGVGSVLDLGGGPGTYAMAFAKKTIDVTLFDAPETMRISRRLIREAGLRKKVTLKAGDFMKDDLGGDYDMVFISQIFHAFGPEACTALLRRCRSSLNPGGKVVVQEFYLDETKAGPPQGAIFAINMLVNTPHGRTYTPKEISAWMKKAGFSGIRVKLLGETVLITGNRKKR